MNSFNPIPMDPPSRPLFASYKPPIAPAGMPQICTCFDLTATVTSTDGATPAPQKQTCR
ncbi:hypothetical protein P175DRAFT_0500259 [Aspergillus ochraceoroseus IBT 24754]|uniref:Uncharacterized protein n=1 Tax=Aspergillus ochraceoroseus IBT 24754 TaxID=1392256 RepID=A0A2T5LYL0_9EURO|nr:uncharacterized protein P175DRAFT_0500259 [Aspergillus ochraceoroseus IBT 24754]PTU21353.1 hypothetical protein P175DRAFT_0500259 [Aspergillus ochraceoroseus IBT 24754]